MSDILRKQSITGADHQAKQVGALAGDVQRLQRKTRTSSGLTPDDVATIMATLADVVARLDAIEAELSS